MGKFKLIIEYDGKCSTSSLQKDKDVSIPEIIGILETTKITFISDNVNRSEHSEERSSHEKVEKKSQSTRESSN